MTISIENHYTWGSPKMGNKMETNGLEYPDFRSPQGPHIVINPLTPFIAGCRNISPNPHPPLLTSSASLEAHRAKAPRLSRTAYQRRRQRKKNTMCPMRPSWPRERAMWITLNNITRSPKSIQIYQLLSVSVPIGPLQSWSTWVYPTQGLSDDKVSNGFKASMAMSSGTWEWAGSTRINQDQGLTEIPRSQIFNQDSNGRNCTETALWRHDFGIFGSNVQ